MNKKALKEHVKANLPLHEMEYVFEMLDGTIKDWRCKFSCKLSSVGEVNQFIEDYCQSNRETLRVLNLKKCGNRSKYLHNGYYRCHHSTRYEGTRENIVVQSQNPTKRFKNTNCPYTMSIKVKKEARG